MNHEIRQRRITFVMYARNLRVDEAPLPLLEAEVPLPGREEDLAWEEA